MTEKDLHLAMGELQVRSRCDHSCHFPNANVISKYDDGRREPDSAVLPRRVRYGNALGVFIS